MQILLVSPRRCLIILPLVRRSCSGCFRQHICSFAIFYNPYNIGFIVRDNKTKIKIEGRKPYIYLFLSFKIVLVATISFLNSKEVWLFKSQFQRLTDASLKLSPSELWNSTSETFVTVSKYELQIHIKNHSLWLCRVVATWHCEATSELQTTSAFAMSDACMLCTVSSGRVAVSLYLVFDFGLLLPGLAAVNAVGQAQK